MMRSLKMQIRKLQTSGPGQRLSVRKSLMPSDLAEVLAAGEGSNLHFARCDRLVREYVQAYQSISVLLLFLFFYFLGMDGSVIFIASYQLFV